MKLHAGSVFAVVSTMWLACPAVGQAKLSVTKTADSLVDPAALTIDGAFGQAINGLSFQQDAVISHAGYQYVGYYDGNRRVCIARRKLPGGDWRMIRFEDYDFQSNDAHNIISIGICPRDGTIHVAFDHHGHPLHYRASHKHVASDPESVEWSPALFGPVTDELETGKPIRITYPRFIQTPDGNLQFCYRRGGSGSGDRMLVDYDGDSGRWSGTRQIDSGQGLFTDTLGQSNSRCSYPNGYTYGPAGRLHVTWVWREDSQGANHDLVYVSSEDRGRTWLNNGGQVLAGPPQVNSPGIAVVPISQTLGLMNTHGQAVDSKGRVHVVVWHCTAESLEAAGSKPGEQRWGPPEARRYHHYWRQTDGRWNHRQLPGPVGNRPKVFIDSNDNAWVIYATRDPGEKLPDGHLHRRGDLTIAAATAAANWTDWQIVHTEPGPFVNEILADPCRWATETILSVMVQQSPAQAHEATALRILDFTVTNVEPGSRQSPGFGIQPGGAARNPES